MNGPTIRSTVEKLLTRKRPMTYDQIVEKVHAKHPEAQTSVKTVQWYASRMRQAGEDVRVKRATRH